MLEYNHKQSLLVSRMRYKLRPPQRRTSCARAGLDSTLSTSTVYTVFTEGKKKDRKDRGSDKETVDMGGKKELGEREKGRRE